MPVRALSSIFMDAPLGFVIYELIGEDGGLADPPVSFTDTRLAWLNRHAAQLIGQTPEKLTGISGAALMGRDWENMAQLYRKVISSGSPMTYTRSHKNFEYGPDQEPFEYQGVIWFAPPYICIVVRDVEGEVFPLSSAEEVEAAMRLGRRRSEETLRLARMVSQ